MHVHITKVYTMTMQWLPEGFQVESASGGQFLNLPQKDGEQIRFAIVGGGVSGYRYWNTDNKPVNLKDKPNGTPKDLRTGGKYPDRVKQFLAFPVWDYAESKVAVFLTDNSEVIGTLYQLLTNPEEGMNPEAQYLRIERSKQGGKVKYTITVPVMNTKCPKPEADAYAEAAALDMQDILFRTQQEKANEEDAEGNIPFEPSAEAMAVM